MLSLLTTEPSTPLHNCALLWWCMVSSPLRRHQRELSVKKMHIKVKEEIKEAII